MRKRQSKARGVQLEHKRIPVVMEGELQRFLELCKPGGEKRLQAYWKDRFEEMTNDSYHRVYVNKGVLGKASPLKEDVPALKEALGLGDGEYEYFLVFCSW